jgi:hypothetical protein
MVKELEGRMTPYGYMNNLPLTYLTMTIYQLLRPEHH